MRKLALAQNIAQHHGTTMVKPMNYNVAHCQTSSGSIAGID
ncbi:MAG TPA: hypothetical protein VEC35_05810 [Noviherbaspirillum sp.]|nr:hypothetical protein [Noviherbaspirillum sp.]